MIEQSLTVTPCLAPYEWLHILPGQDLLLDAVRKLIEFRFLHPDGEELPISWSSISPVPKVNVTLRVNGQVHGSMSGEGNDFREQLENAVFRSLDDTRFITSVFYGHLDAMSIEVWIQCGARRVSEQDIETSGMIDFGEDGVELVLGTRRAYYKPSVGMTSAHRTKVDLLRSLCRKAGLPDESWRNPEAHLTVTQWVCFALPPMGNRAFPVQRLRQMPIEKPTPFHLESWYRASVGYMIRLQRPSGEIQYVYDPLKGLPVPGPSNSVRTSGCFFALCCALAGREPHHGDGLERSASLLYRHITRRARLWAGEACVIADDLSSREPAKLGTTALLTCGLAVAPQSDATQEDLRMLLRTIERCQQSTGLFASHVGIDRINEKSGNYFSGQALLALLLAAQRGRSDLIARCEMAFPPYRTIFRDRPTSAFVGWHVDVWSRMAALTGDGQYAQFVFEQADWLLSTLPQQTLDDDRFGGLARPGQEPNASTVVFAEALCCALKTADMVGDGLRVEHYSEVIRRALAFCSRLRVESIAAIYRPSPQMDAGGITASLTDSSVRCDHAQHFVTLCLRLQEVQHLVFR